MQERQSGAFSSMNISEGVNVSCIKAAFWLKALIQTNLCCQRHSWPPSGVGSPQSPPTSPPTAPKPPAGRTLRGHSPRYQTA